MSLFFFIHSNFISIGFTGIFINSYIHYSPLIPYTILYKYTFHKQDRLIRISPHHRVTLFFSRKRRLKFTTGPQFSKPSIPDYDRYMRMLRTNLAHLDGSKSHQVDHGWGERWYTQREQRGVTGNVGRPGAGAQLAARNYRRG